MKSKMTVGFFHYKKPNQVLTVYYTITPANGKLKFSCSLWKNGGKYWNRKEENRHATENFLTKASTHTFTPFEQGDLKLDDVWLRSYIHRHICQDGCKGADFIANDIPKKAYKTIDECYKTRGHSIAELKRKQRNLDFITWINDFLDYIGIPCNE